MCDYSLMNLPNRLANEGEILVTHRFSTSSIGFVSPYELCDAPPVAGCAPGGFWKRAWRLISGPSMHSAAPAVCIPPGARLRVLSFPERLRGTLDVEPEEELTFTQVTAAWNQFRDALRTRSGQEILLQAVGPGLEVEVVSVSLADEVRPAPAEYNYSLVRRR